MTNIIIGDIAEGQRWYGQVEFMKQQLVNTYRSNNAFMSTWKQLSPDVKVFIKMVAGKPQAFIYVTGGELICALGNPYIFAAEWAPRSIISKNGEDWVPVFLPDVVPPLTPSDWGIGAFNGNVIIGVKEKSSLGVLSYDRGATWVTTTLPEVAYWSDIIWNGEYFCMISTEDSTAPSYIAYSAVSPDGINWTTGFLPSNGASSPTTSSWASIAWNGDVFCAVATRGAGPARTAISPDGLNWTATDGLDNRFWADVAWNGTVFCAVSNGITGGSYTNDKVATSIDGITWELQSLPTTNGDWWNSIIWNGTVFCAMPLAVIAPEFFRTMTSPDGIDWTMSEYNALTAFNWDQVGWSGKHFYAVTSLGSTATYTTTSLDGLNWVEFDIDPAAVIAGLVSMPVGVPLLPATGA